MDTIDKKIINILKENSRTSYTDISKQVDISVPSVIDRINKLNNKGIIKRYTIELDNKSLGKHIEAIICVELNADTFDNFFNTFANYQSVIHLNRVVGPYNAVLYVAVNDTTALENLIDNIKEYGSCHTLIVTRSYS